MEAVAEPRHSRTAAMGGKYLTFSLANEEYGLEILKIREIIGIMDITAVPQMPVYIKGVVNLRGKVIPVIDLRLKFGLEPAEYTEETCIIVVDIGTLTGVIVDTVQEVLDIDGSQIDPPPPLGASVDTKLRPRHGQGARRGQDTPRHRQGPQRRRAAQDRRVAGLLSRSPRHG